MTFLTWTLNPEQLLTFYMDKHNMDKCISGLRTVKIAINNVPFQDKPRSCGFIY